MRAPPGPPLPPVYGRHIHHVWTAAGCAAGAGAGLLHGNRPQVPALRVCRRSMKIRAALRFALRCGRVLRRGPGFRAGCGIGPRARPARAPEADTNASRRGNDPAPGPRSQLSCSLACRAGASGAAAAIQPAGNHARCAPCYLARPAARGSRLHTCRARSIAWRSMLDEGAPPARPTPHPPCLPTLAVQAPGAPCSPARTWRLPRGAAATPSPGGRRPRAQQQQ
jgi:hypothetical protein